MNAQGYKWKYGVAVEKSFNTLEFGIASLTEKSQVDYTQIIPSKICLAKKKKKSRNIKQSGGKKMEKWRKFWIIKNIVFI